MILTFRGHRYESTCNEIAVVESEVTGMYRGNPVKFSAHRASTPAPVRLTYRGTSYIR
jgi:hypothetical protein